MWDSGSYQDIIPGQSSQKANTEPEVHTSCLLGVWVARWGAGCAPSLQSQPDLGWGHGSSQWMEAKGLVRLPLRRPVVGDRWPLRWGHDPWQVLSLAEGILGNCQHLQLLRERAWARKKGSGHSWCLLCTHLGAVLAFADSSTSLALVVLGRPGSGPVLVTFQLFSWQVSSHL